MLKIHTSGSRTTLAIENVESLESLQKRLSSFVELLAPEFPLSVVVTIATGETGEVTHGLAEQALALAAFEEAHGSKNIKSLVSELGISRSSWYNWKDGRNPISRVLLSKLIETAPNDSVRGMLIGIRK